VVVVGDFADRVDGRIDVGPTGASATGRVVSTLVRRKSLAPLAPYPIVGPAGPHPATSSLLNDAGEPCRFPPADRVKTISIVRRAGCLVTCTPAAIIT
jgi:hypothetical protein